MDTDVKTQIYILCNLYLSPKSTITEEEFLKRAEKIVAFHKLTEAEQHEQKGILS